jgi:hypothetical protein
MSLGEPLAGVPPEVEVSCSEEPWLDRLRLEIDLLLAPQLVDNSAPLKESGASWVAGIAVPFH